MDAQTGHILVVDDNPDNTDLLVKRLKRRGYTADYVASGPDALEKLDQAAYDAVLLDYMMPGMDGMETLQHIRQTRHPNQMPVIMVTAKSDTQSIVQSLQAGANDYIHKPIEFQILFARLANQVALKKAEERLEHINEELEEQVRKRTSALMATNESLLAEKIRRNEAELLMRESQHQFREAFLKAGHGIALLNFDGSFKLVNTAFCRMLDYDETSLSRLTIKDLTHNDDWQDEAPQFTSLAKGRISNYEVKKRMYPSEREEIFVRENISLILDQHGKPRHAVAQFIDVTETHKARETIEEKQAYLQAILNSAADAIIATDGDGLILTFNQAAEILFGFQEKEMLNRDITGLLRENQTDLGGNVHTIPQDSCLLSRGARDVTGLKKTGEHFTASLSVGQFGSQDKRGMICVIRDISERMDLEHKLRHAAKMEAVGRLTGGVAHDFNNLLTVIIGNLQLLERSLVENEKAQDRVGKIMKAAKSGAELTRRLLTFSRQQVLETTPHDVNEVVRDLEQLLGRTVGADITVSSAVSETPFIGITDKNQLESALLNLCVNARDAMPDGGRITIETKQVRLDESYASNHTEVTPGEYYEIAVSDTGNGIPPDIVDKIFEPFFTTKASGQGTGLGLSTVFGFMKQSGGHLAVYSELGFGTTFKLYVPMAPDAAAHIAEQTKMWQEMPVRPATILVVEDDPDVREVAVTVLRESGFIVREARTGPDGLRIFSEDPKIEAVFSDVVMPGGMLGPEMGAKMRDIRPDIPIMFASGYAEKALEDKGGLLSKSRFISKPYNATELPHILTSLLETHQ
ncbi:response regulator [Paremcibacter congregatus]|uniref:response regulator n=1 Tax=Paremcibacter congregatus TaxID=2043170 RepID=UPI0030EB81E0|tara:strand:- start:2886 stop:5300 length:2415 start_codon:yes stop_codon:yes gene_type:complete